MDLNSNKLIDKALQADVDTLYAVIGYFDNKNNLGLSNPNKETLVEKGKEWLSRNENKLQEIICNNDTVKKYLSRDDTYDQIDLILLLTSLFGNDYFLIPSINIAALIVKIGVKKICKCQG